MDDTNTHYSVLAELLLHIQKLQLLVGFTLSKHGLHA
jgi:hypothetical protein